MWQYRLFDYDPAVDEDFGLWCQRLADEGWESWAAGAGATITQNGRRVHRMSLRRWSPSTRPGVGAGSLP